jgi:uncharacterized membrane protein YraQ (UPF0718 family)
MRRFMAFVVFLASVAQYVCVLGFERKYFQPDGAILGALLGAVHGVIFAILILEKDLNGS